MRDRVLGLQRWAVIAVQRVRQGSARNQHAADPRPWPAGIARRLSVQALLRLETKKTDRHLTVFSHVVQKLWAPTACRPGLGIGTTPQPVDAGNCFGRAASFPRGRHRLCPMSLSFQSHTSVGERGSGLHLHPRSRPDDAAAVASLRRREMASRRAGGRSRPAKRRAWRSGLRRGSRLRRTFDGTLRVWRQHQSACWARIMRDSRMD
jgi:hypothetical protein